ncbi:MULTISPECIES: hypothetical protein [Rhizobium]|nr:MULTISPECIES: hypothetical protein [Rhizobium]
MALVYDHERCLSRHREIAWLSSVCSGLHILAAIGSFAFVFALVIGLI